jgi:hypothetical protein
VSEEAKLTPLEYAVYGVLCAAKRETGPDGARRIYRIQDRLDNWDDQAVERAMVRLLELGWARQTDEIFPGMVHFEATTMGS